MPNLLPLRQKKELKREYHLRFAAVLLTLFIISCVASITLLLPAYISVSSKKKIIEKEIAEVRQSIELQKGETILALLEEVKSTVKILLPQSVKATTTAELFSSISAERPAGLTIHGFSYQHTKEKDTANLTLVGKAQTREDLITFVKELRTDARFSLVDLPISDLVKSKNLSFTITISGVF